EAIADLTPSRALYLDRAHYLEQLGEAESANQIRQRAALIQPAGARDHYLLATTYARQGNTDGYARALSELELAIALSPRLYWAWVQRVICHQELGEHVLAAGDFAHCTGLWPEFAWGYFNLGYVLGEAGKREDAVKQYTEALRRDPT